VVSELLPNDRFIPLWEGSSAVGKLQTIALRDETFDWPPELRRYSGLSAFAPTEAELSEAGLYCCNSKGRPAMQYSGSQPPC